MGTAMTFEPTLSPPAPAAELPSRSQLVLVVEDRPKLSRTVGYMCEFLGLPMECVETGSDLPALLDTYRPMAVICELKGGAQDGCQIMKAVAMHDPNLPILLVTGSDEELVDAADAVERIWHLANVVKLRNQPGLGDVVDFLFRSGRLVGSARALTI